MIASSSLCTCPLGKSHREHCTQMLIMPVQLQGICGLSFTGDFCLGWFKNKHPAFVHAIGLDGLGGFYQSYMPMIFLAARGSASLASFWDGWWLQGAFWGVLCSIREWAGWLRQGNAWVNLSLNFLNRFLSQSGSSSSRYMPKYDIIFILECMLSMARVT